MKHERGRLLTGLLLTLLLILVTSWVSLTSQSPCLGNNCLTLARGSCFLLFPISCVTSCDRWGNYDEWVHPVYSSSCWLLDRTLDVWLYQCAAPPPSGAVGIHAQWMKIRTYRCGTVCRSEFVTKKQGAKTTCPEANG